MNQYIAHIALIVDDYDSAIIRYYTQKLKFKLIEDTVLNEEKRWVLVAPPGSSGCNLLLAKATNEIQKSCIGNQSGGRVFLFLHTDDFERDYKNLVDHEISIIREPIDEDWGRVLVFQDKYGNLWDLIQPKKK
jgi:catechol 2,3-dioxygenase-like lactoylglutathione lyase family enzyme